VLTVYNTLIVQMPLPRFVTPKVMFVVPVIITVLRDSAWIQVHVSNAQMILIAWKVHASIISALLIAILVF